MTPQQVLGVAREWYDSELYPTTDDMLFALLVDVAHACEQAIARRDDPLDRPAGITLNLAQRLGPRESMLMDLRDNLEHREGDRTG
jgi:hypothetical protein